MPGFVGGESASLTIYSALCYQCCAYLIIVCALRATFANSLCCSCYISRVKCIVIVAVSIVIVAICQLVCLSVCLSGDAFLQYCTHPNVTLRNSAWYPLVLHLTVVVIQSVSVLLPRDAMLARYMPWSCVRLSVCLSVCPSVCHKSEFY